MLRLSFWKEARWHVRMQSHITDPFFFFFWSFFNECVFLWLPYISVWIKKENLCWWSNETAVLQEPGATCAHTAREWVMKWQRSNADLAGSARYNLKDIAAYSKDQLQPHNKDTILLARWFLLHWLTLYLWQTYQYSHWRRSSCREIPATGTHRTPSQVRSNTGINTLSSCFHCKLYVTSLMSTFFFFFSPPLQATERAEGKACCFRFSGLYFFYLGRIS